MLVNHYLAILTMLTLLPSRFFAEFLVLNTSLNALESFILSNTLILTTMLLLILLLKLLNANKIILIIIYVIFVIFFMVKNSKVKTEKNVHVKTFLNITLIVSLLVTLIGGVFSATVNRTYVPDEAGYAYAAQLLNANGYTYSLRYPILSPIEKYLGSRFLWVVYLFFANNVVGIPPYELYKTTPLFLAFLTPVVMAFFYDLFELQRVRYNVIITIVTLASPTAILWSLTNLVDVAESYFILSAIYFIIKFSKQLGKINNEICYKYLLISLYFIILVVVFLRNNITTITIFILILIFYVFIDVYFGKIKLPCELKFFIYLIVAIIFTFIIIDFTYFISVHVLKNIALAILLRRLLVYGTSLTELVVGWFVSYPWKPQTVFSYSLEEWLRKINFAAAPEINGLAVAGTILFPLWLDIRNLRKETRTTLLAATVSFLLYFINLGLLDNFHDISRYCLHLYLIFTIYTLMGVYNIFFKSGKISLLFIGLLIPFLMNSFVSNKFGGTTFFWIIKPYTGSETILILEYLITTFLAVFSKFRKKENEKFEIFIIYLFLFLFFRLFFINVVFENDLALFSQSEKILGKLALDIEDIHDGNFTIVLSNFHVFLRNFLSTTHFVVIPLPLTVDDFCELVKVVPKGTLIVLTDNWKLSYYTTINSYLFKLVSKENATLPCGAQISRVKFYKYDGSNYAIFIKGNTIMNSSLSWDINVKQTFVWDNRSCVIKISNLTNDEFSIIYTVKFSYLVRPNVTSIIFPYIDPVTRMNLAYQICYIIFLVKPTELNILGFGATSLMDLCILFAFQEILLVITLFMLVNRKPTF